MSSFASSSDISISTNPLLAGWTTTLPPFQSILPSHFEPAFSVAMKQNLEELEQIAGNEAGAPSFENTIAALDRSGSLLSRVEKIFDNLCSSNNTPELQEVQTKMAGPLAKHYSAIYTFPGIYPRVRDVYLNRESLRGEVSDEQIRLIERFHLDFLRAGAQFTPEQQERYTSIVTRLAELTTLFTQNVMADESKVTLTLNEADGDLEGLPDFVVQSARSAAEEHGQAEGYVITLSRSLVVPFLTFSSKRSLREKAWRLWTNRGELDPSRDNLSIAKEILLLRAEQAAMHGHQTFADYAIADTMATVPSAVSELLERVWSPAKLCIDLEKKQLLEAVNGELDEIEPWDWRYYAEKVRQTKYDLDETELKPYFPLDRMCEAIFDCANRLFGLRFVPREDLVAYHPDVKTYEVRETVTAADGTEEDKLVAIFLHDNYARQFKQGGAWMSEYRSQGRNVSPSCGVFGENGDSHVPIIVNNNNFAKSETGEARTTLLSFDDAKTLFHEFGHGLHGMLSDVTYQRLAGTSVLRDFVELPSQLYEHWLSEPQVLKKHARHFETGEPIPDSLLQRLMSARNFNQGFETVEYTSSALVDQALHRLQESDLKELNISEFETKELERLGMPKGMVLRHRPAHFQHLFSGSSYAAAYYVYLWAEVLDADGFDAFLEKGDIFDGETASRLRRFIYSSGNSIEPGSAFRSFRGRDPVVEPMLKKKGLLVGSD